MKLGVRKPIEVVVPKMELEDPALLELLRNVGQWDPVAENRSIFSS